MTTFDPTAFFRSAALVAKGVGLVVVVAMVTVRVVLVQRGHGLVTEHSQTTTGQKSREKNFFFFLGNANKTCNL